MENTPQNKIEYVYLYVLIGVLIIYLIIRQCVSNETYNENFDPSLVPVSSVVTLAKVAQKLVDGNGTLTNPGNLAVTGTLHVGAPITIPATTNEYILSANGRVISAGSKSGLYFFDQKITVSYLSQRLQWRHVQ